MKEEELKRRTEKHRAIPERTWTYLRNMGFVDEALEKPFEEDMVDYIIKQFNALAAASPGYRSRGQIESRSERRDTVRVSLGELELERKAALEEYLAMCAASNSDVYLFRKEVLKGELVTEEEARELIRSPAAGVLSIREFENWNIPVVGHAAVVKDRKIKKSALGETHSATLHVDPPGREISKSVPILYGSSGRWRSSVLEFLTEEGKVEGTRVWGKSLLDELRAIGEKLGKSYRWQPAQAVWFVLAGEIPAVPALQAFRQFKDSMDHRDCTITIEASPWVSSKAVERAFRKAQIKTMGSAGGKPPGEKNLKLFRFVVERIEPLGMLEEGKKLPGAPKWMLELELVAEHWYMKMPEGKELVSEWNETYPQWSYKDDTRRFWRDYNRIRKSVTFGPPYQR